MLDYVEFLRARSGGEAPATASGADASWPGTRFAPERNLRDRDADRPSAIDEFLIPPPRRRAGPIVLGVVLVLAVAAVGGFLYYRYVWSEGDATGASDAPAATAAARAGTAEDAPSAVAAVADAGAPGDAVPELPSLTLTLGGTPDADVPASPEDAPAPQDAGSPASAPDAPTTGPGVVPPAVSATGVACGALLDEARALWRGRERDGALQKLREAIACDPSAVEPLLQWGRWFVDTASLARNRETSAEGAALLQPAAEANPDHGELWFHYTNLLFGSRQREAAQAAREHCIAIRPSDEYSASCRFLPQ
ncbi:MAG: hypothetical protein JXB32_07780 [Deltaproteobacteria bacterium]|nr:hypothetical protein [Deltaproteobacteria bacterium]